MISKITHTQPFPFHLYMSALRVKTTQTICWTRISVFKYPVELEMKNRWEKKAHRNSASTVLYWIETIRRNSQRFGQELGKQYRTQTFCTATLYPYTYIAVTFTILHLHRNRKQHHVISGSMSFPMRPQVAWEFCNHTNASIWKQSNCVRFSLCLSASLSRGLVWCLVLFFFWACYTRLKCKTHAQQHTPYC